METVLVQILLDAFQEVKVEPGVLEQWLQEAATKKEQVGVMVL